MDIAIDIGSTNTRIFVSGNGVVLCEPTKIAFNLGASKKRIVAFGNDAYSLLGKAHQQITLVSPVTNGVISDVESMSLLLKEFFAKVFSTYPGLIPRMRAIVGIPTGISSEHRRVYEEVVFAASGKIKEVFLIENTLLAAISCDLPVSSAAGGLIANIGGGATEIAAISLSGILSGCGLTLGGGLMDKAITESLIEKTGVRLGPQTVRKIKDEIASLYPNDITVRPAQGIAEDSKQVESCTVRASDIYTVLEPYYIRVGSAIENILNACPPDVAGLIARKGIFLVGGGSKIPGLKKLLLEKKGISATIPPDPEYASIMGAGQLFSDKELLKDIVRV